MSKILKWMACFAALLASPAAAEGLEGAKTIWLVDGQGARIEIGAVRFRGRAYQVELKDDAFTDHFLSMRPFKCLEGPDRHWCHVPYPHAIQRRIGPDDLTDLEYDLLFVWKGASDYGINMWNGVYYRLTMTDRGTLTGQLHEVDMDVLSLPPQAGDMRPLSADDLHPADPDSHWLPGLVID